MKKTIILLSLMATINSLVAQNFFINTAVGLDKEYFQRTNKLEYSPTLLSPVVEAGIGYGIPLFKNYLFINAELNAMYRTLTIKDLDMKYINAGIWARIPVYATVRIKRFELGYGYINNLRLSQKKYEGDKTYTFSSLVRAGFLFKKITVAICYSKEKQFHTEYEPFLDYRFFRTITINLKYSM